MTRSGAIQALNRRIVVSVTGMRIKAFKKRHEDEPDPDNVDDGDDWVGGDGDSEREK